MITPQDDLIGHQLPYSFAEMVTSDPSWMERYWYTCHPTPGGDSILDVGLGYHPNKNVMDGFAGLTIGGKQYNFRASRRLHPNPLETKIGPLEIKVLEGLKRHKLTLGENESGLTFELEFISNLNAHEEEPHFKRRNGIITEHMARTQQFGRFSGWIEINGKRITVDENSWYGQRDHSWGIRGEMRTDETNPPLTYYPPFFYMWVTAQFKDRGLHVFLKERAVGNTIYISGEEVFSQENRKSSKHKLVDIEHDITWADDPMGQTVSSGKLILTFKSGEKRELYIRTLPARYFLKGGLYGGLNGWSQGDDKGEFYSEADSWDLSEEKVRKLVRTICDHVIEIRDGDDIGYGIMEY